MDALTFNTKHLLYTLFESGVRYFVISPGSRSTPIALLLAEYAENNQAINLFVDVDERSAGFFALGIAKTVLEPVVLLGTSGTAIAEYMPAIAEASVSSVPLVVLSTDRPQELQHNGAPQTISQNNLFGHQTKEAIEINLQDQHSDVTNYIDFMIQRLVHLSMMVPRGPIQINLPLRKPLMPILKDSHKITVKPLTFEEQVPQYQPILIHAKRLLILAGPNVLNSYDEVLNQFAAENHVPVITDVLSRSRGGNTVYGIDMLLEMNRIPVELNPDLVIRFGKTPVSARVLQWLKNRHIETWHIDEDAGTDHTRHISRAINMAPKSFLNSSQLTLSDEQKSFNQKWQVLPKSQSVDNEMSVVPAIDNAVADNTHIFVANSMPIRDMDNFFRDCIRKMYLQIGVLMVLMV
ncbi:hypothetical protein GCM10025879_04010 [Leuconostoc litchii]|nr:hypothetical protein GCM10025879_04010 [Leuconostoc litchii]